MAGTERMEWRQTLGNVIPFHWFRSSHYHQLKGQQPPVLHIENILKLRQMQKDAYHLLHLPFIHHYNVYKTFMSDKVYTDEENIQYVGRELK